MPTNILMPALSPTMTEGTLARWLKREGEAVAAGDVIAEIETDKATMEVEAADEGVLGRILVPEGTQNVAVNAPIAILVDDGETLPTGNDARPAVPNGVAPPGASPAAPPGQTPNGARVVASPLARRLAGAAGIDLRAVTGTGPHGRIVRADIDRLRAPPAAAAAAATGGHRVVPHTAMRRVIARRLTEAKQTIPHFYLTMDMRIDALLKLRADLNARAGRAAAPFKLSVNDLVIKAAALALRQVPAVNASYTEAGSVFYDEIDIAVAVAIPDGLITPVIRRADGKSVVAISAEMKDLAARAKAGKLKPEEFQGGGFSISNLGMYGISQFAAVINPPQGAILAVGAGVQRPVAVDGALAVGTVMSCTLSVDHRVIDGAPGAEWLQAFRAIIEDPLAILL